MSMNRYIYDKVNALVKKYKTRDPKVFNPTKTFINYVIAFFISLPIYKGRMKFINGE